MHLIKGRRVLTFGFAYAVYYLFLLVIAYCLLLLVVAGYCLLLLIVA